MGEDRGRRRRATGVSVEVASRNACSANFADFSTFGPAYQFGFAVTSQLTYARRPTGSNDVPGIRDNPISDRDTRLNSGRMFLVYELELASPLKETSLLPTFANIEMIRSALASYPSPAELNVVAQPHAGQMSTRAFLVIEADEHEERRINETLAPHLALAGAVIRRVTDKESAEVMTAVWSGLTSRLV
jgi:hypothetical protein